MKQTNRKLRNLILILTAAAIVAGGSIYLVSASLTARREAGVRIDDLLAQADYDISLGYNERALESLGAALKVVRGQYNSLRILKRVYLIAYESGDYSILHDFAENAAEGIPGSEELARIHRYAAIRCDADSSRSVIEEIESSRRASPYLQAEAFLSGLLRSPPETREDPGLARILSLVEVQDAHQLRRVGIELEDPRIQLDAALMWMSEGDTENAFALVNRNLGHPLFQEPGVYISYDSGQEQTALSLIEQMRREGRIDDRPDLQIMEADLRLGAGETAAARRLYRRVLASHPDYSWMPYLNLAAIVEGDGDKQNAYALRERAYGRFPVAGPVVTAYAGALADSGEGRGAEEVLVRYLEEHGEDYRAELFLLEVRNTAASPAVYQAELWKLYNRHPESRLLCEHLFLYLLEFNDLSAAESVLRHYQGATGRSSEPWLLDFRAILAALRRDNAEALRLLEDRLAQQDSWRGRFNMAVVLGKTGSPEATIEQLIKAENLLSEEPGDNYRSRIRSRIGEQYLRMGDEAAARRECEYAVDLDVSNFHAHRILRILERE